MSAGFKSWKTGQRKNGIRFIPINSWDYCCWSQSPCREPALAQARRGEEEHEYELTDLTEEETEFLNLMLDEEHIVRMSAGYSDKGRYIVMDGPLKTLTDRITRVDRHNRIRICKDHLLVPERPC